MNLQNNFRSGIESLDAFRQPATIYFEGRESFRSFFGGLLTLILIILVFILSLSIIRGALNRDGIAFTTNNIYTADPSSIPMTTKSFMIAVFPDDVNHKFNYSMMGVRIRYGNYNRFPNGTLFKQKTVLPLFPCKISDFPGYESQFIAFGFERALCPIEADVTLTGAFLSNSFHQ